MESEFKGTQGEWNTVNHLNTPNDFCIHSQGKTICTMPNDDDETIANAQLIKTSPKLFQALLELHNYTKQHRDLAEFVKFQHLSNQAELALNEALNVG